MAHLIDKDAIVAEIEKLISNGKLKCQQSKENNDQVSYIAWSEHIATCGKILSLIDTIEVKGVDLEKVFLDEYSKFSNDVDAMDYAFPIDLADYKDFAEHFFLLGLRVNNPITAADRGMAEEIIVNLKRLEKDYHIDLTKEMEWLRNKVKKGE